MKVCIAILLTMIFAGGDSHPLLHETGSSSSSQIATSPSSFRPEPNEELQPAAIPYFQEYGHGPEGYDIRSGFEGYLLPSAAGSQKTTVFVPIRDGLEYFTSHGGISKVFKHLSSKWLKIVPKIAAVLIGVVALFTLGCLITTAVCSFTPFCTISFLGWGVARESMRAFLTEDNLSATAAFVTDAIKKYKALYGDRNGKSPADEASVKSE